MRLRAYFSLESSLVVPVFVVILLVFVMAILDMHDEVVIRSIDVQVSMKLEQELYDAKVHKLQMGATLSTAVTNIAKQCVTDMGNSEQKVKERVDKKELITKNRQPQFVRIISAGLKLVEE